MKSNSHSNRISFLKRNEIYFWTATINNWKNLLEQEIYKQVILDSLQYLSDLKKIDVFDFVIMPNHFHSIIRVNEMNGKENPQGSFLKYTAHQFKKLLQVNNPEYLEEFRVVSNKKEFEFWQRDPLGIPVYSREVALQKLSYIHNNPISVKWQLSRKPWDYRFSSAGFYHSGKSDFKFLKNIFKVFP